MGRTTALRREIKKTFVPYMAQKDFSYDTRDAPSFQTFRKITPDAIYACDIQWEKYGRPRFVVNFGKCGPQGVTICGERVPPDEILPYHGTIQGRLSPRREGVFRTGWFRQDRPIITRIFAFSKLYPPADVVSELMTLFVELEQFWDGGPQGKHIRIRPPFRSGRKPQDILEKI